MDTDHEITESPSSQGLGHESRPAPYAAEHSVAAVSPDTQSVSSPSLAAGPALPAAPTTLVSSAPDDAAQVSTSETEIKKKYRKANTKVKEAKKTKAIRVRTNKKVIPYWKKNGLLKMKLAIHEDKAVAFIPVLIPTNPVAAMDCITSDYSEHQVIRRSRSLDSQTTTSVMKPHIDQEKRQHVNRVFQRCVESGL